MKYIPSKIALVSGIMAITVLGAPAVASAATPSTTTNTTSTTCAQTHLQDIITKGDEEITRRLTQLDKLDGVIAATTKLTASDKSYLSTEVNNEIPGLTQLKTHLDADTTCDAARADAQSIFTEYRVYALVTPKVYLVKTADDQQVVEGNLNSLATKLQTRINQDTHSDRASLQNMLNDLESQARNAQGISSNIEQSVLPLQPSDYNSNHAVLSGDETQLKQAHSDNQAAYTDAKNIISALKNDK